MNNYRRKSQWAFYLAVVGTTVIAIASTLAGCMLWSVAPFPFKFLLDLAWVYAMTHVARKYVYPKLLEWFGKLLK
jgi:hypothetical protein